MLEFALQAVDFVLHLNTHLEVLSDRYGLWIYVLLFVIVFAETGLVVFPFLPGDSLLFAAGALAATGSLDPVLLCVLLMAAGILGNSVNYSIGKFAGRGLTIRFPNIIRPHHMRKTHEYFARYGGKTLVIARFVPIVRTIAPFAAGIGQMRPSLYMFYNVLGCVLWVMLLVPAGYFFANFPVVQDNFSLVILGIIFLSILPGVVEYLRERSRLAAGRADR